MKIRKIAFLLAVTVICTFMLTACGEEPIDISQHINVVFDGLNGKGTARVNRENLDAAIESIILGEDEENMSYATLNSVDQIEESIKLDLDKNSGLSNGDTVTVNISADTKKAKENGIKLTGMDNLTVTVSGLKDITEIDPFDEEVFNVESGEGIYIEYTGVSPRANIQIRNTLPDSNPLSKVQYGTEESFYNNIKKGQTITIVAKAPSSFEDDGIVLSSEKTTVTCEKVDEYIRSVDDIDDETMQKIVNQCNDLYKSKFESYSDGYNVAFVNSEGKTIYRSYMDSISDFKYQKEYFFALKEGLDAKYGEGMKENGLFITATVNLNKVKNDLFAKETHDYKNCNINFRVYDIVKNKDGEIQYKADMVKYGTYIYVDEDTFKTEVINSYLDTFEKTDEKNADFK